MAWAINRDGFALHVLPLLLQLADIRVHVKTRVQRRTTCDLAVTIQDNTHNSILLESSKTRSEAVSTNSSTAAALIGNTTKVNRLDNDGILV